MNLDNYLAGYLDRRMTRIIDEWQISTRGELVDLTQRLHQVQNDLAGLKSFEKDADERISIMEQRVQALKERQK